MAIPIQWNMNLRPKVKIKVQWRNEGKIYERCWQGKEKVWRASRYYFSSIISRLVKQYYHLRLNFMISLTVFISESNKYPMKSLWNHFCSQIAKVLAQRRSKSISIYRVLFYMISLLKYGSNILVQIFYVKAPLYCINVYICNYQTFLAHFLRLCAEKYP